MLDPPPACAHLALLHHLGSLQAPPVWVAWCASRRLPRSLPGSPPRWTGDIVLGAVSASGRSHRDVPASRRVAGYGSTESVAQSQHVVGDTQDRSPPSTSRAASSTEFCSEVRQHRVIWIPAALPLHHRLRGRACDSYGTRHSNCNRRATHPVPRPVSSELFKPVP